MGWRFTQPFDLGLLADEQFRRLWIAEIASRVGFYLSNFLLPLIVASVLGGTGLEVGAVSAAQFLPVLLLSLVVGRIVDRVGHKYILLWMTLARVAAMLLLAWSAFTDSLSSAVVVGCAALIGSATVLYDVALLSFLRAIVVPERLTAANSYLQAANSVTQLGGPSAAGVLLDTGGSQIAILATGFIFVVALVSVLRIPVAATHDTKEESSSPGLREIFRYLWICRPLRDLCIQAALFNLFMQACITVFMIFAVSTVGLSAAAIGVIVGVGSLGAVIGSVSATALAHRFRMGRVLGWSLPLSGSGMLLVSSSYLFGIADQRMFFAGFFVNGFGLALFNVLGVSYRVAIPPENSLAAVSGVYRLFSFGPIPVGALVGGFATDYWGAPTSLISISSVLVVTCCWLLASPVRRIRDLPDGRQLASSYE